jgi:hypothetical protein
MGKKNKFLKPLLFVSIALIELEIITIFFGNILHLMIYDRLPVLLRERVPASR